MLRWMGKWNIKEKSKTKSKMADFQWKGGLHDFLYRLENVLRRMKIMKNN